MYVHSSHKAGETPWRTQNNINNHQKVRINPIRRETTFYFHVDFENLDKWELGMLLYALRPTDGFRPKLGMGKSIGLGTVCIDPVGLFLLDREKRYSNDDIFASKRYHQVYKEVEEFPNELYHKEAEIKNSENVLSWQDLREYFRKTVSPDIRQALEILGDPTKVIHPVHTPQIEGKDIEQETFKWFAKNERKGRQEKLKALDKNSKIIPPSCFNRLVATFNW